MQRHSRIVTALAVSLALLVAVPAGASAQSTEEKANRIKAAVEEMGLTVLSVDFLPPDKDGPPYWFAYTQATYARPSWPPVANHALRVWLAVNSVVGADDPKTMIYSGQVWSRYVIQIGQENAKVSEFARAVQAAKSADARNRAANTVLRRFIVRIYDREAGRFTDAKDFVNKNFID